LTDAPSPWVVRFAPLIPRGGVVLDLACGHGRHARHLAALGYRVEAVDRDATLLAPLSRVQGVTTRCADLEDGPWPYRGAVFDGVVVTRYLHRPLLPDIISLLAPDGVLIYETFMSGNERFGKPSNPAYLLRAGELLEMVRDQLTVVAFEQGRDELPKPAMVQRICAVRSQPERP
jgi:SAM-dependent methyltransferase